MSWHGKSFQVLYSFCSRSIILSFSSLQDKLHGKEEMAQEHEVQIGLKAHIIM